METHSFWEFKKYTEAEWFRLISKTLLWAVLIYFILHISFRICDRYFNTNFKLEYEYAKLDDRQKQVVNRIYFDSTSDKLHQLAIEAIRQNKGLQTTTNTNKNPIETPSAGKSKAKTEAVTAGKLLSEDTLENGSQKEQASAKATLEEKNNKPSPCDQLSSFRSFLKYRRALNYIDNEFNNKIDTTQRDSLNSYLSSAQDLEAVSFLSEVRLQVKSYFWLTGPAVYFEIAFWSVFGVICSLLFNLGVVGKDSTTDPNNPASQFDSTEIPYQFAKILYTPLATLAIVLGYNFFNDANIADISSSKGVIVFAFIGGFYSSRLIAFLDRLKEIILPNSGASTFTPSSRASTTPNPLDTVTLTLNLDDPSITTDLRTQITEVGLQDAIVSLEDEKGTMTQAAMDIGDDTPDFIVKNIQPGKYTIKATWSKEIAGETISLEGLKSTDIDSKTTTIDIILKRTTPTE